MDYSLDFVTDLPLASGCNTIVTVVDRLTKWVTLIPCHMGPDHPLGAEEVASLFFRHIVCRFGLPRSLVHDRDARLTSAFWTSLWRLVGTRTLFSSAHHP